VLLQVNNLLCLDGVYHLGYFYVMCCECDEMVIGIDIEAHNKNIHSHPILFHFLSTTIGSLDHNQA